MNCESSVRAAQQEMSYHGNGFGIEVNFERESILNPLLQGNWYVK